MESQVEMHIERKSFPANTLKYIGSSLILNVIFLAIDSFLFGGGITLVGFFISWIISFIIVLRRF